MQQLVLFSLCLGGQIVAMTPDKGDEPVKVDLDFYFDWDEWVNPAPYFSPLPISLNLFRSITSDLREDVRERAQKEFIRSGGLPWKEATILASLYRDLYDKKN